jgi:hypothetical protein
VPDCDFGNMGSIPIIRLHPSKFLCLDDFNLFLYQKFTAPIIIQNYVAVSQFLIGNVHRVCSNNSLEVRDISLSDC